MGYTHFTSLTLGPKVTHSIQTGLGASASGPVLFFHPNISTNALTVLVVVYVVALSIFLPLKIAARRRKKAKDKALQKYIATAHPAYHESQQAYYELSNRLGPQRRTF
jgi:hypothetical protein